MNLFRSGLFCLFFMLAGNLLAENVTITIDVSSLSGTDGNYIWNSGGVSGTAKCAKCNDYNCLKFSSSSNNEILNTTPIPGSITSVTIVPHNVNDANSLEWYVRTYTKAITTTNIRNSSTYWDVKDIRHGNGSWIIDKIHGFFYLNITTGIHCDIDRIIITYKPTPQPLTLVAQQNDTYYATFSNTQPTFFPSTEGVKIMTAYVEGGNLNTSDINNDEGGVYVPANTGVLISSTSPTVNYLYSNNKEGKTVGTNMLHPATESMDADTNYYYKLAYDNYTNKTGLGFYWGAANGAAFDRKAGTAYLAVPKSSGAKGFHFDFDGETSVEALERSDSNAPVYNLQGQKVTDGYCGVYIRGGKKYFKK